jgi:flagellar hook-associated protein 3 FlgL
MRVANRTIFDSIKINLDKATEAMAEANMVVSSGKRINRLSDDPVGLATVLDLRSSLANIEQLQKNINTGRSWLNMAESALSQIEDVLSQGKALTVEMSSANRSASDRYNASTIVDGYLRQVFSLANTQVAGRYIFAGTETSTQPFAFDDDNNPTLVTYAGNDDPFAIKIGKDTNVDVGRSGEQVFGANWDADNIFKTLIDLKTALQGNDVQGIQSAMQKLDDHLETIRNLVSDTAGKVIRLDVKEKIIQDLNLTYTERMSKLEDADIAAAIVELEAKGLAYQAALNSSAKVMKMSLLNYL